MSDPVFPAEPPLDPPEPFPVSDYTTSKAQAGDGPAESTKATAGRKGATRFHELVERGKLYEQEEGLKPGRQRQAQLVEMGRLYEKKHGLAQPEPLRRVPQEEVMQRFMGYVRMMAKPTHQQHLLRMADGAEAIRLLGLLVQFCEVTGEPSMWMDEDQEMYRQCKALLARHGGAAPTSDPAPTPEPEAADAAAAPPDVQ